MKKKKPQQCMRKHFPEFVLGGLLSKKAFPARREYSAIPNNLQASKFL